MGLFSSKTKVSVSSVQMNILGTPPDNNMEAVLYAILSNSSIPEGLLEAGLGGIAGKVDKFYRYARDEYTLGLPNGVMSGLPQPSESTIKGILEPLVGQPVQIAYSFVADLTPEMAAMEYLRTHRGFKFNTNTATVHPFVFTRPNQEPLLLESVEYLPATNQLKINYIHPYTAVVFDFAPGTTTQSYESFSEVIPYPEGLFLGQDYCVAAYILIDPSGNTVPGEHYWHYRIADGTYPELNTTPTYFGELSYLPIIPIRRDNVDMTSDQKKGSELYITSKKLLNKLSIDIDTLAEMLNANPDIAEIDHAYVMFGINVQTQKQESMAYLCDYFDYLADVSIFTQDTYLDTSSSSSRGLFNVASFGFSIPDVSLQEHGFNIKLKYDYITSIFVPGNIGKVGFITSRTVAQNTSSMFSRLGNAEGSSYIQFRQQVTPTLYKEITVHGLVHTNTIYKSHAVTRNLFNSQSADDEHDTEALLIPVHYGIAKGLSLSVRNKMYYDSCRLVINTYVVTKVKWYQKGIFKIVFVIIAIVIAVYSGGTQSWLIGLAAAAQAGAMAVIMYVLPTLLIGLAVSYAAKLLAKAVGGELALLIGAIAVIATIAINPGGSFQFMGQSMTTAQSLLSASSALLDAGNSQITSDILDVEKETALFQKDAEKQWDALEEASKILDSNSGLDPIQMTSAFRAYRSFPAESPDAFYNRTIHTGNIGVLVLDVIENYAGIMLKLPEVKYVN